MDREIEAWIRAWIRASGTVIGGFSDHLITFSSRSFAKVGSSPNVKKVRSMKLYSKKETSSLDKYSARLYDYSAQEIKLPV